MNKRNGLLKIFLVILCLFFVSVFALIESGETPAFVTAYKNNFKRNISGICGFLNIKLPIETQLYLDDMSEPAQKPQMTPAYIEDAENEETKPADYEEETISAKKGDEELTIREEAKTAKNLPTAFSAAANTRFEIYQNGIICANETVYARFSNEAKLLWNEKIQMQEPVLKTKGDYVLVSETGAKKISLYRGKKLMFTAETEGNILTADLSEKGDVIAVTGKEYYKGQVVVFNKSGKRIFVWDSGSYSILDAAISKNRKVAISLLNTDEGASSIIQVFDVKGNDICKTDTFSDTVFFEIGFDGETLSLLSESKCVSMSIKGKIKWEYNFDGRKIKMCSRAENGNRAILFDNDGIGEIVVLKANGKAYPPIKTETMPDTINIKSRYVAYNNGRNAILTNYNATRILASECGGDIKQIYITGSDKVFCVYGASVQEQTLKKLPKVIKQESD
ncbi:MAG: hypothetical protein IK072_00390 [Clostridia bacterium]|nr:hypothetical protein [Clostridia bacterium]